MWHGAYSEVKFPSVFINVSSPSKCLLLLAPGRRKLSGWCHHGFTKMPSAPLCWVSYLPMVVRSVDIQHHVASLPEHSAKQPGVAIGFSRGVVIVPLCEHRLTIVINLVITWISEVQTLSCQERTHPRRSRSQQDFGRQPVTLKKGWTSKETELRRSSSSICLWGMTRLPKNNLEEKINIIQWWNLHFSDSKLIMKIAWVGEILDCLNSFGDSLLFKPCTKVLFICQFNHEHTFGMDAPYKSSPMVIKAGKEWEEHLCELRQAAVNSCTCFWWNPGELYTTWAW